MIKMKKNNISNKIILILILLIIHLKVNLIKQFIALNGKKINFG